MRHNPLPDFDTRRATERQYEQRRSGRSRRRVLDRQTELSFLDGADMPHKKLPPQTKEALVRKIKLSNPAAWLSMKLYFKWLRHQVKKNGYDPEIARFLL